MHTAVLMLTISMQITGHNAKIAQQCNVVHSMEAKISHMNSCTTDAYTIHVSATTHMDDYTMTSSNTQTKNITNTKLV